ncbi:helix-turn-helix protein [Halospina denitrificans]|uniref:Helix-turn-helix protein n=1 Tax=Halospina denitrificans TaxID=332522 RepID=A0A4R7JSU8_9GAMM|nr:helix-turn-helix transcriptional regulator [Halospina denitrificans]TDT41361.1 helix-turn-helix protein [Halospina denitrificans]
MKYNAKQFGINVREVRRNREISQDQLALRAGIDRSYMGRIERGQVNITLEKVYRLAEALDCSVRDLLP